MNSPARLLFPILLILALGLGTLFLLTQGSSPPQDLAQETQQPEPSASEPVSVGKTDLRSERTEEKGRERIGTANPSGSDHPQGVHGRVVDQAGIPIHGVQVYLVESATDNPFLMTRLLQMGMVYPPVAQVVSEFDGRFDLGLRKVIDNKSYELRFTSDRYADFTLPGIKLFLDKWYDAGDIAIELGTLISGRVTAIGAGGMGMPIEGAEVSLRAQVNSQSTNPTPGRERGIIAFTDASGRFRIENAPEGSVTISAVKEGYAKVERPGVRIRNDRANIQDFQLPKGLSISGRVIESTSAEPVPGAKVTAIAFSSKTPLSAEDRANDAGEFHILGLVDGPYQLMAVAPGYDTRRVPAVKAGDKQQTIVLDRLGSARIRVTRSDGSLLRNYQVMVRGYFKENPDQLGLVQGIQPQRVRPQDLQGGVYEFTDLNKGTYVFEVNAKGYAKTHSEPFTVTLGGDPRLLEVSMLAGGSLEGILLDSDGNALADVTVSTMMNHLDENPLLKLFGNLIQYRISKTWVKTDAAGHFILERLTPGTYQLKFSHREHYDIFIKDNPVAEGGSTDLGQITMHQGTLAFGWAYLDGKACAQVKVTISRVPDASGGASAPFMAEAISDTTGRFEIMRRLPPGRYQARAARQTLANPLLQIVDFQKTQTEFTVTSGQSETELNFRLQSRN